MSSFSLNLESGYYYTKGRKYNEKGVGKDTRVILTVNTETLGNWRFNLQFFQLFTCTLPQMKTNQYF